MIKFLPFAVLVSATVHALPLDFEGASGSPVTVTLDGKIDYIVTTGSTNQVLAFVFRAPALTNFAGGTVPADVNLYFTINGAPFHYELADALGTRFGGLTALNFTSAYAVTVNSGDVVTLWGGSATTSSSVVGTGPTEASFDTYLMPFGGVMPAAPTGVYSAIPEPSSFATLAGLATLTLAATRRSRK